VSRPGRTPAIRTAAEGAPITVLGSLNMDLVTRSHRLPRPGETILGTDFATVCGGKGGNQAIAAARAVAGRSVRMLGAVGDDAFGPELRAHLAANHVQTNDLRTAVGPSGIAAISVDDHGENVIVVVPGANGTLTSLTAAEEERIGESGLVVCQLEIPLETVVHAASICASTGRPFLLNPSPVQDLPPELLAATTVLVLNEGEAAALGAVLTGQVPHVVITRGARGVAYRGADGTELQLPAPAVPVVDTTGAGDAFTGALAVAWLEGRDLPGALRFGCAAGALACMVSGADAAPDRRAILALAS
jgi:ribokinase